MVSVAPCLGGLAGRVDDPLAASHGMHPDLGCDSMSLLPSRAFGFAPDVSRDRDKTTVCDCFRLVAPYSKNAEG